MSIQSEAISAILLNIIKPHFIPFIQSQLYATLSFAPSSSTFSHFIFPLHIHILILTCDRRLSHYFYTVHALTACDSFNILWRQYGLGVGIKMYWRLYGSSC